MKEKNNAISIEELDVAYDKDYIIKGMNVEIPKGKITMIIGSNGCGKSTLLKNIARIITPKKGSISLHGEDLKKMASKDVARKMAVLPQSPSVPTGLLVKQLVSYGRFPYQNAMGSLTNEDLAIVDWALEVTDTKDYKNRRVDRLSGGQRQRVWIAMALAQKTEILVLDEPTTYLDMANQLEILLLLEKLNKEHGTTIVMVLHELNNATKFADHLIGIKNGSVIFEGEPLTVITKENLKELYGIEATLQLDETKSYPICIDFAVGI